MALSDFERELAASKSTSSHRKRDRDRDRSRSPHSERKHHRSQHHHRHRHHSHRDHGSRNTGDHDNANNDSDSRHTRHRHKRPRRERDPERGNDNDNVLAARNGEGADRDAAAASDSNSEHEWVEKAASPAPASAPVARDAWMQAPEALEIDYVQRRKTEALPQTTHIPEADAAPARALHRMELNHQLHDTENGGADVEGTEAAAAAPRAVEYTFGDAGSAWRMTRLRGVYRQAEQSGKSVDVVARERYGDLRAFDEAREEELELDRRKMYGKGYVGKEKPSGELFEQRNTDGLGHEMVSDVPDQGDDESEDEFAAAASHDAVKPPIASPPVDQTTLNKLKAQLMRAKLKRDPAAAALEAEYNRLASNTTSSTQTQNSTNTVTLTAMDARFLAGLKPGTASDAHAQGSSARRKAKAADPNLDPSNESIASMLAAERRTHSTHQGSSHASASASAAARIAADPKFAADNEYMDENAARLAAPTAPRDAAAMRNAAIAAYGRTQRALAACPLCHDESAGAGGGAPVAPVVSLATRVFLTLPPAPALGATAAGAGTKREKGGSKGAVLSAMVAPIAHHGNLLECDEDEWEEVRNFMKALTRCYAALGLGVVFYEDAARGVGDARRHAALVAVPLPTGLAGQAPAFFREAVLAAAEEWSQHRKVIDTLGRARDGALGRMAFRRSMVAEMPYFHVWFGIDGGMGHVVEDVGRWPRGDLFAREVIGGMLEVDPEVIRRQGRWTRGDAELEKRVRVFRTVWEQWDWTRALVQEG